jgi:ATP-dependent DNA helicase RecG
MDSGELEALLSDLESDRTERKPSLAQKDEIRQAICAFANDLPDHRRPGVVFIGVRDDGICADLRITDELLRELADIRSEGNILPIPVIAVQKRILLGCELAVVIVQPSDSPPVRLRGRTVVRVGPTTRQATAEEERRLSEKRRAKDVPFDLRPLSFVSVNDLDVGWFEREYLRLAVAPDVLERNTRSVEQQLTALRFLTADGGPTVLGVLALGKDPRQYLPGAYVQFLRISGATLTDPIKDQKEIGGMLSDKLRILDETMQAHTSVAVDITSGPLGAQYPDYPIVALRQLAFNAILHRNYEGTNAPVRITWFDGRIEILSPGGPYGLVNRENFGKPGVADYRNPHLAEVMRVLGYVQRFGVGIALAREELKKNGNPPPEFQVEDTYILAVVRGRP